MPITPRPDQIQQLVERAQGQGHAQERQGALLASRVLEGLSTRNERRRDSAFSR